MRSNFGQFNCCLFHVLDRIRTNTCASVINKRQFKIYFQKAVRMSRLVLRYNQPLVQNLAIISGLQTVQTRNYSLTAKRQQIKRASQTRELATGIIQSPLGAAPKIPNENLVEYVYKGSEQWIEEPAAVSFRKNIIRG